MANGETHDPEANSQVSEPAAEEVHTESEQTGEEEELDPREDLDATHH